MITAEHFTPVSEGPPKEAGSFICLLKSKRTGTHVYTFAYYSPKTTSGFFIAENQGLEDYEPVAYVAIEKPGVVADILKTFSPRG